MFTQPFTQHDRFDDFRRVVRNLWNQNDVCASCDTRMHGDPAGVTPHDLNDDDSPMALCRCVQFVECLASRIHSGVETEGAEGASNVVVDGLGNGDEWNALLVELFCYGKRAVAANDDKSIEVKFFEIGNDSIREIPF